MGSADRLRGLAALEGFRAMKLLTDYRRRVAVRSLFNQAREEANYMRSVLWYDTDTGDSIPVKVWTIESDDFMIDSPRP